MCGRVVRTSPKSVLEQLFMFDTAPEGLADRYNLAPKQSVPVIRHPGKLEHLRWGLTMPDPRMTGINARMESLTKPIYRDKVRDKRCLVVVDGFYEWKAVGGKKHPYFFSREDKAPLVFAGFYDDSDGVAIITKPAAGCVAALHDRMPVVLEREAFDAWLDPGVKDVRSILVAATADALTCFPVSDRANSIRNDDPSLIERVAEPVAVEPPKPKQMGLFG